MVRNIVETNVHCVSPEEKSIAEDPKRLRRMDMKVALEGQVAVVTGGAQGIGRGYCGCAG